MKHAAVIGKHFDYDILLGALNKSELNMSKQELNNSLRKLIDKNLIKEVDSITHEYSFDHALIHETIYNKKFVGTEKENKQLIDILKKLDI